MPNWKHLAVQQSSSRLQRRRRCHSLINVALKDTLLYSRSELANDLVETNFLQNSTLCSLMNNANRRMSLQSKTISEAKDQIENMVMTS